MDSARHALALPDDPMGVVAAYERIRDQLPQAKFPDGARSIGDLMEIEQNYDLFLFDAFGVLNIGDTAIAGAAARLEALRRAGRSIMLVSNAASLPRPLIHEKYRRLGFDFSMNEIVTSRDTLIDHLAGGPLRQWGVLAPPGSDLSDLPGDCVNLNEDAEALDRVDGFILLAAAGWHDERHRQLVEALRANPRTVLVANPDLVAPREHGLSLEPGLIAHSVMRENTGASFACFGKPYPGIFRLAMSRLGREACPARVLMVGDTLHTDILGGRSAGFQTALVIGTGVSRVPDIHQVIASTSIVPDFICPAI